MVGVMRMAVTKEPNVSFTQSQFSFAGLIISGLSGVVVTLAGGGIYVYDMRRDITESTTHQAEYELANEADKRAIRDDLKTLSTSGRDMQEDIRSIKEGVDRLVQDLDRVRATRP